MTSGRQDFTRDVGQGAEVLEHLRQKLELIEELDELVEQSQQQRFPLRRLLNLSLPIIARKLGAVGVCLSTLNESLERQDFKVLASGAEDFEAEVDMKIMSVVTQNVVIAGSQFGDIKAYFEPSVGDSDPDLIARREALLLAGLETIDDALQAIYHAREKQTLTRKLHADLSAPLVDQGIAEAVKTLAQAVDFEALLVVYHQSEADLKATRALFYEGAGELIFDSTGVDPTSVESSAESERFEQSSSAEVTRLRNRLEDLKRTAGLATAAINQTLREFGFIHEVSITLNAGLNATAVLGKIILCANDEISTYERDLIAVFGDALEKRVIDFDRESRVLNRTFSLETVSRLLRSERYEERYLAPRHAECCVLFTDISGFTRISEQILVEPRKVGQFIQSWGEEVVKILWAHGGACDKFVGDCLIGLFGPPFFEEDPEVVCMRALRCADAIQQFTQDFVNTTHWQAISDARPDLGVATGIHYCPVAIGGFGLNCGYTAFSSGMNNTARLQGVASRHEILVMDSVYELTKDKPGLSYSPKRESVVKNVAEPLQFYQLLALK